MRPGITAGLICREFGSRFAVSCFIIFFESQIPILEPKFSRLPYNKLDIFYTGGFYEVSFNYEISVFVAW